MKRIVNRKYPDNVIIVRDAYVNGNRIVCDAGTDYFDLWLDCWAVEDAEPVEYIRKDEILAYLDKWMEHAVRGMQKGATAYHQGKVALITDIRDWLNREDER